MKPPASTIYGKEDPIEPTHWSVRPPYNWTLLPHISGASTRNKFIRADVIPGCKQAGGAEFCSCG